MKIKKIEKKKNRKFSMKAEQSKYCKIKSDVTNVQCYQLGRRTSRPL